MRTVTRHATDMQPGEHYTASCCGKSGFAGHGAAERIARRIRRRGRNVEPYRCHFCLQWHIGRGAGEQRHQRTRSQRRRELVERELNQAAREWDAPEEAEAW